MAFPHRPPRPIALGRTTPRHPRTAGGRPPEPGGDHDTVRPGTRPNTFV
ncbi:hypothetical protein HMPREF1550_01828 [Actinomyces sp. oral taxon 877 str. F0543]|nr:hypothetical protein HMPREF1550_01828 [Actinomyces sp. oral taxon 877 str. F0543]